MKQHRSRYNPQKKRIIVVGNYGSGKTEISVNLALELRARRLNVSIADLDVVNPYFRCREEQKTMMSHGIRVVVPEGEQQFADLPIILPEIKGMLQDERTDAPYSIFDVGGNDVGARVLAAMKSHLGERSYSLLQVINTNRPFTSTCEGCLQMMSDIEKTASLRVTGLVANSHLMEHTTPEVIKEGYDITCEVSRASGVPIDFVAVAKRFVDEPVIRSIDAPLLVLNRRMTPPWVAPDSTRGKLMDVDGVMSRKEVGS